MTTAPDATDREQQHIVCNCVEDFQITGLDALDRLISGGMEQSPASLALWGIAALAVDAVAAAKAWGRAADAVLDALYEVDTRLDLLDVKRWAA